MDSIRIARIVARSLIGVIIFFTVIIISLQLIEPYVGKKVVAKVQKELPYGCEIKDFQLSIFKNFPSLTGSFSEVIIMGSDSTEFITAGELNLDLDMWELLDSKVMINSISLSNGSISVKVNEDNLGNWNILNTSSESGAAPEITVRQADLKNMYVNYIDKANDQNYQFVLHNGQIHGKVNGSSIELDVNLENTVRKLNIGELHLLENKATTIIGDIIIDLNKSYYAFKDFNLRSGNANVGISGTVNSQEIYTYVDFEYDSRKMPLKQAIDLLPQKNQETFTQYSPTGICEISGLIKGKVNQFTSPEIQTKILVTNGGLQSDKFEKKISALNLNLMYSQDYKGLGNLEISSFSGNYGTNPFTGNLKITNVDHPIIDLNFSGQLPLVPLLSKEESPSLYATKGIIDCNNFYLENYKPENRSNLHASMGGEIKARDIELKFNENNVAIPYLTTELREDDVFIIDSLKVKHGRSDFRLEGSVRNVVLALFRSEKKNKVNFDLSMQSEFVDLVELNEFIIDNRSASTAQKVSNDAKPVYHNLLGFRGKIRTEIEALEHNKIKGRSFSGSLFFNMDNVDIKSSLSTSDGILNIDGNLDYKNRPEFSGHAEMVDINIHRLFYQWDGFRQNVLGSEHLQGNLDAVTEISLEWDENAQLLTEKIDAKVAVAINNGALKNFKMLESFSTYVDIRDLRNIQFSKLTNLIIIRDRNVFIPAMFVQSNAMNLMINGIHTFDQKIDYNVKVNAGQVMATKFQLSNQATKLIPAKKNGWFNLYYTITGDLDEDFEYQQDRSKVQSSFWQSIDLRDRVESELQRKYSDLPSISQPDEWKDMPDAPLHADTTRDYLEFEND